MQFLYTVRNLYDYQPSRNGDCAADFLKDFNGYVHSDGYSGYNKLTNITRCGCWAHLRRKFVEAIPSKRDANASRTSAEIGRDYCDQLFHIEKGLKDLSAEERKLKRLELEKPVLDGRCALSNNAAENAIRPFIVGRKNWLFADSTKGATASAVAYSIIETAKANNLNVYAYLEYLLLYMPDTDWRNYPKYLDDLMPWSEAVQAECGN